jgi:HAD superfamily hydrolase (TIGR01490 family)
VAGRREGYVTEGRLDHSVDWRAEAEAAVRVRNAVEDAARAPERLAEFAREAEREHGHSGPMTVAADAERRRVEWVAKNLVDAGRERARTLGWTDCYTFTKALAERAVEETAAHLPVTIYRPSIIESALEQPYPGWIEGFKMAEPIILAYGRGDLPDFPGVPDSTIDIIPVDYVVSSIIAAVASVPEVGRPHYFTVCSGARNPLSFRHLYEYVREFFQHHPLEQRDRGALRVPEWQWPGAERVDQLLRLGDRAHRTADRVVSSLPRSNRTREWARSLDRQKRRIEFLRRYFDLYRPYAEAELLFTDDNTLALYRSLHPDDATAFAFDAEAIDWHHYLTEVHVPAVTEPLRAMTRGRSGGSATPARRELTRGEGIVAVFDMDGTLLPSNVVESYLWLRLPELSNVRRAREVTEVARSLPRWLLTERRDRGAFLRSVYRRYEGASYDELLRIVDEDVTETVLGRLSAAALRTVRAHRAAGHRTILITGAVAPLVRPVASLFDEIVAADLEIGRDGRCTGFLTRPPLVGEGRASWLRHRADSEGWDLAASYGYADSASDLPMLRSVGHPVAVDPDIALSRVARRSRWPVEMWHAQPPVGRVFEASR